MSKFTTAHLFSGGGGDTSGALAAGYKPLWAVESDKCAAAVYRKRFPHVKLIETDIKVIPDEFISSLPVPDCLIAGTPCPDFSYAGKRAGLAGDRGQLFFEFVRFLRILQPSVFIFENVAGLLSSSSTPTICSSTRIIQRYEQGGWGISKQTYQVARAVKKYNYGSDFKQVLRDFGQVGYQCTWQVRNGKRWVPQNRARLFVVGIHCKHSMPQN